MIDHQVGKIDGLVLADGHFRERLFYQQGFGGKTIGKQVDVYVAESHVMPLDQIFVDDLVAGEQAVDAGAALELEVKRFFGRHIQGQFAVQVEIAIDYIDLGELIDIGLGGAQANFFNRDIDIGG